MSMYIWENYSADARYELKDAKSYMEVISNGDRGFIIDVNRSDRAKNIFFKNSDGKIVAEDQKKRRYNVFTESKPEVNFVVHLLRGLDEDNRLTRLSFDKEFFRNEIESERYGSETAELFGKLSSEKKDIILYFIVKKQYSHNRRSLFENVVSELFEKVILYNDNMTDELVVFTLSKGCEDDESAWELSKFFFKDMFTDVKIVWNTEPMMIGSACLPGRIDNNYTLY